MSARPARSSLLELTAARLAWTSLTRARSRLAWAASSLAVVAALATSLLGIRALVGDRIRTELERFGPNVVIEPADAGAATFPASWLPALDALSGRGVTAAVALRMATVSGDHEATVTVAGVHVIWPGTSAPDVPEWAWPLPDGAALASPDVLTRARMLLEPAGLVVVGSPRPGQLGLADALVPMSDAHVLAGGDRAGVLSRVLLRVRPEHVDEVIAHVASAAPGLVARPVQRIAHADAKVLGSTSAFIGGAALVLLILAGLCFSAAIASQWVERRSEMALMIALGARRSQVARLVAGELAGIALVAGIAGSALGVALAAYALHAGFGLRIDLAAWPWWTVLVALALTALVAGVGGAWPAWRVMRREPIGVLRGAE